MHSSHTLAYSVEYSPFNETCFWEVLKTILFFQVKGLEGKCSLEIMNWVMRKVGLLSEAALKMEHEVP